MELSECQSENTNANLNLNLNTNSNDLDSCYLNKIRESIENMSKFNQIEVLRILTNHKDVIINENKYGIHINLSELDPVILEELLVYIKYVNTQEIELNNVEKQKQDYKNNYFLKDNKDNVSNNINNKYATNFKT
uniref:NET domain-containing protein n=1 Tax=viral metagenome TaxID=1070528 RepID=A0A6C0I7D3_9ZZZZ